MTYPPTTPGGWQDPTGASPDPAPQQPTYIDPISGQPATVANPAAFPTPTTAPGYPSAYPTYGAPESTYTAAYGQPDYSQAAYSQAGYQQYQQYPGYPGYPAPVVAVGQKTNGLSIASLVVSLCGLVFLFCYGGGAVLALLGAILGHVSRGQIKQRNEGGGGMALAGIIIGWIALALGAVIIGVIVWAVVRFSNDTPTY